MKVFLAGATGVLGQPTVRALIEAGHDVRGTARGEEKSQLVRSLGAKPVAVDLFDSEALKTAIAGSEAVLHFATKIPPLMRVRSKGAWRENNRLRSDASRHLVDAAISAGSSVYIYESITFLYGEHGYEWISEDSSLSIAWPAALNSTLDAEREVKRFTDAGGRGISLRYAAFYAPYAQSTRDTVWLARRRMLPVPGDGANFVSSIHVDDAATAAVAALDAQAGVYNVADDEPLRMRDYARTVTDAFGLKPPRRVPRWLFRLIGGGPAKYILSSQRVSNARFKDKTDWSPKYPSARDGWQQIAAEIGGS
ncbi:MAG TPA: NAD(P)-dependent oxidoreductase [Dehalococcoidia bacterium]|jgi:nucleoside-diphosphate-sugar epimerase|nr:NAD(P)-dependent oxidoreductase [Dehalococcoidia bacterium]